MNKAAELSLNDQFSYTIWTGENRLQAIGRAIEKQHPSKKVALVVDENVDRLHGDRIRDKVLGSFDQVMDYVVPEGEQSKRTEQWQKICTRFLQQKMRRTTPLVAVGGGVTGDLAGFAAATLLRGVPLVHLPTTLLAMVDSSIGGKTGINHRTGKNLIGSFYQPQAVYEDISFLTTLNVSEWVNGLSEILKYAAIADQTLFKSCHTLTRNASFEDQAEWLQPIQKSARIKAEIVEQDARESGVRAFLNFGHTFAHALEGYTDYGRFSHGEAVFLGMHAALYASKEAGAEIDHRRLEPFNHLYNLEISDLYQSIDELIERMYYDKKIVRDTLKLVLLQDWEDPYVTDWYDHDILRNSWKFALDQFT